MSIWFNKDLSLENFSHLGKDTLESHIGIEFTEIGADFLKATMPVDHRTHQPYGLLHGGASAALAETLGSVGAALVVDKSKFIVVGLEINANHISSVKSGFVTGIASPFHIGRSTQVWDIKIYADGGKLVCVSRLTVAVLEKNKQQ